MKKEFTFGKVAYTGKNKSNLVTIEVELKEDKQGRPVFSACGNIWNDRKSDIEMGGQCIDSIFEEFENEIKNKDLYIKLMNLWQRNHLNDMNAGTKEQEVAIKDWKSRGNKYDYTKACEYLKSINLYEVPQGEVMYKYGSSWIYREISKEDVNEIKNLLN